MRTLKGLFVLFAVGAVFPSVAFADLLTFRVAGAVSSVFDGSPFLVGRPYTLTLTIDTASSKRTVIPERGDYLNAVTSFVFDYDSGIYTAQGQNNGGVDVHNAESYDKFDVFGLDGFPAVAGQPHTGTYFWLVDTSAIAFASTDLPRTLNAEAFQSRFFQINWGIDWDTRTIFLTVESITLVERRPEITAWSVATNALRLEIEFPVKPYTNILERSFQLGPSEQWDPVATFISSGGKTNWVAPLQTSQPKVFYRMRQ